MKAILLVGFLAMACVACLNPSAVAAQDRNVLIPQKGVGAPFGARDPRACSSTAYPEKGPISEAMAKQYFICGMEKVNPDGYLFLEENVKLQVGRGVVPRGVYAVPRADQDPNAKVYAIRGSFDQYMCSKLDHSTMFNNIGKNCGDQHVTNATGSCYRTTFGDWKCQMVGGGGSTGNVPPPQN